MFIDLNLGRELWQWRRARQKVKKTLKVSCVVVPVKVRFFQASLPSGCTVLLSNARTVWKQSPRSEG